MDSMTRRRWCFEPSGDLHDTRWEIWKMLCKLEQQSRTNANQAQSRAWSTPFPSLIKLHLCVLPSTAAGVKATFLGNAPCGVYKYKLPKAARTEGSVGRKVFFFKAILADGAPGSAPTAPLLWVKKSELQEYLKPAYMTKVDRFILNLWPGTWRICIKLTLVPFVAELHSLSINILMFNKTWFRKSEVLDVIIAYSNQWNR